MKMERNMKKIYFPLAKIMIDFVVLKNAFMSNLLTKNYDQKEKKKPLKN